MESAADACASAEPASAESKSHTFGRGFQDISRRLCRMLQKPQLRNDGQCTAFHPVAIEELQPLKTRLIQRVVNVAPEICADRRGRDCEPNRPLSHKVFHMR